MAKRRVTASVVCLFACTVWALSVSSQFLAGAAAVASVDANGCLQVNGEPFFPIGLYQVPHWDLGDVKAHGFNIVDEIQPVAHCLDRTFLDAAARAGLWVRIALYSGFSWWNGAYGPWEPNMRETLDWAFFRDYPGDHMSPKHHPATLMWYLEDEPRSNEPPIEPYYSNLRAAHAHLKATDPGHPDMTCLYAADFQVADSAARLTQFRRWSFPDVVAVDCYALTASPPPNPYDAPLTAVAKWMDDLCLALTLEGRQASPQIVIEAFQFGGWRMPTRDQLRLMVYLAILHGAKGVWYFCYGTSERGGQAYGPGPGLHDDPAMWAYVGELNRELAELSGPILSPPLLASAAVSTAALVVPDRYGYPPIHQALRSHDGWTYLLAANGSEVAGHDVSFTLSGEAQVGAVEVLFEGRSILTSGGSFSDRFEPMAVHVYRWRNSP